MAKTFDEGVVSERARWHDALAKVGIRTKNKGAYDVAQVLKWRLEVAEEMAIDVARNTVRACAEEGILDEKNVMANLNSMWQIYKDKYDEEMGESDE